MQCDRKILYSKQERCNVKFFNEKWREITKKLEKASEDPYDLGYDVNSWIDEIADRVKMESLKLIGRRDKASKSYKYLNTFSDFQLLLYRVIFSRGCEAFICLLKFTLNFETTILFRYSTEIYNKTF